MAMMGILWSCDPMEDTYNQLDNELKPYKENISYTLVSADYSTASSAALATATNGEDSTLAKQIKSANAFNEKYKGSDYIYSILSKNFPALNKESVALITYNEAKNLPEFYNDLGQLYVLQTSDYKVLWGSETKYIETFTVNSTPEAKMPSILNSAFPAAEVGSYKFLEYNYTSENVEQIDTIYFEDWASHTAATSSPYTVISENGWTSKDVIGTLNWYCRVYSGNNYAQASAYNSGSLNEAWLYKEVDLTTASAPLFTFKVKVGYWNADCLTVWISEDFDGTEGDITTATWVDITSNFDIPSVPASGYGSFVDVGNADLTAYKGKKVYIAFKYVGDGVSGSAAPKTTTYQIDDILISELTLVQPTTLEKKYIVYSKTDGGWESPEDFYSFQESDYESIGKDYISSSEIDRYIPNYLKQLFPFSVEGDVKNIVFKSDAGVTSIALQYVFEAGNWMTNSFIETKVDQFIHTGEKWIFDPTIHLSPASTDYQLLVDYVYANLSRSYGSSYGNDEFYYGASAYYKNFDLRLTSRVTYNIPGFADLATEDEKIALTWTRLQEGLTIMLQLKYTEAVPDINGIPVYYWVTFATYENNLAKKTYVGIFKCTKAGPDPIFVRDTALEDEAVTNGKLTEEQVTWNR